MSSALVSVIIPAYNAEKTIAATLRSALDVEWSSVEIIVVDDGSTDETLRIAEEFAARGVRIYPKTNGGAAAARNHGLDKSSGAYIQYLDADDLLDSQKIARQIAVLEKHPGAVATGPWGRFTDDASKAEFRRQEPWRDFDSPTAFLTVLFYHHLMMHPACWLVPRDVATKAGQWDERLSLDDDGEYFCRVSLAAEKILFVEDARSYYRSGNPSSLSAARSDRAWESGFLSIELCASALLSADSGPAARRALAARYLRFAHECYPAMPDLVAECERRAAELGGSNVQPVLGGAAANKLAGIVGWRLAKRLRIAARKFMTNGSAR